MRIEVLFKNPRTGEVKAVKAGFAWPLFLFSGFLGLPLFLRGLNVWGGIFLALWVVNLIVNLLAIRFIAILLFLVFLTMQIWLGFKGNALTAKHLLDNGWEYVEPKSEFTKMAMTAWGLNSKNGRSGKDERVLMISLAAVIVGYFMLVGFAIVASGQKVIGLESVFAQTTANGLPACDSTAIIHGHGKDIAGMLGMVNEFKIESPEMVEMRDDGTVCQAVVSTSANSNRFLVTYGIGWLNRDMGSYAVGWMKDPELIGAQADR